MPQDLEQAPPARLPFPITRASSAPIDFRAEGDERPMLRGQFTTFNDPYEVHSHIEGRFIERMAPGAFDRTVVESRKNIKVLFNHGQDPTMGEQIVGDIVDLRGDARYVVDPFDGIPPLLRSGLERGAYGASHRFSVISDDWDYNPRRSASNPEGLPERVITEARLYEFGPVTFPANPNATSGIRSTTDDFYQQGTDYESILRSASDVRLPLVSGTDATSTAGSPQTDAGLPPSPEPDARTDDPPTVPSQARATQQDPPNGGSLSTRSNQVEDNMTIEEKRARYDELNDSLDAQAVAHPGKLPEDEQVRWDADVDERDRLGEQIVAYDRRQAQLIDRSGKTQNTERPFVPQVPQKAIIRKSDAELHSDESRAKTFEGRVAEFRDDAKRILEKTKFVYDLADQARSADKVAHFIDTDNGNMAERVKYTSSPAYMRAFEKYLKSGGGPMFLTAEEQRGTALAVGVDGTGGFTVPFAFDPTVIAIGSWSGAVNPYRRACRVVTISGTDTWNALTSTAVVATRTTEAAAAVEQGPTFAQPQYIVKKVQGQITASIEMFQDRSDLASELAGLIAEAKDNEEEASWAIGNGSGAASIGVGPVTGTSGSYTRVSTAGAGAIAAGDADTTEAGLPVRHRFRAQWFMNRTNIRKFQSVETAGGKLFQQSQYFQSAGNVDLARDGNTGLRLLGYPVNESPSLPVATTTTITAAVLLNVDQYVIVDRIGLGVQFLPFILSSGLATGQQALYFYYRNHAAPLNTDAGRILQFL